ncbi:uncharacterized protein PG986_004101 [Apiospora aurea]|uniref:Uncharacterized protein n=1 Tax=Apiospora aurea TaxID=335848 RepID=A0ABR1QM34_9PEZI
MVASSDVAVAVYYSKLVTETGAMGIQSLLVQTTVLDAGNTASRIYLNMFSSTGNCGAAFNPIAGGVPAGNGWYRCIDYLRQPS